MLVLARKPGESIKIGENIEISIVEVSNGVVKLGIEAPPDIKILRTELILEIKEENSEAIKNIDQLFKKLK